MPIVSKLYSDGCLCTRNINQKATVMVSESENFNHVCYVSVSFSIPYTEGFWKKDKDLVVVPMSLR